MHALWNVGQEPRGGFPYCSDIYPSFVLFFSPCDSTCAGGVGITHPAKFSEEWRNELASGEVGCEEDGTNVYAWRMAGWGSNMNSESKCGFSWSTTYTRVGHHTWLILHVLRSTSLFLLRLVKSCRQMFQLANVAFTPTDGGNQSRRVCLYGHLAQYLKCTSRVRRWSTCLCVPFNLLIFGW